MKAAGYKVAATYAGNDEAANKFKAETGITVYKFDVSDYDACAAGVAAIEKDLGPVEMLVNNAGITKDRLFHKMELAQWNAVIGTNLNSLFNVTRPVINGMRDRGFGRIIVISSINGQKGQAGQTNYSASKAGDIGFVKALAQEGASKGITVNAIAPGYIATEMVKAVPQDVLDKHIIPLHRGRPPRRAGGNRARRGVPRRRRRRFHHRLDPDDQRRPVSGVRRAPIARDSSGARQNGRRFHFRGAR